ncbi:transcription factor TFIIS [Natronoglomus mannanivorans]|uniref:Transcription factor TFIIS n=1 Tax=Natronoglomus mannanivorans TaxID=2979990 RepID=A0AAP2Z5Q5_9EURY|nr:transcription factor TFIIS [Halobacteria archaeon AArc-xg1-1]MCU4744625.1 transcription factor TFIIS [Halobacteria archaeon AArc-xg1-1]
MSIDDSSSISGIARNQQAVSVDGSLEGIFEPDGSLWPATRIVATGGEESLEAWLEAVAPDRLATIDERVDELPATRAELISHHVEKILEETEAEGRAVESTPELETPTLVITYHQRERGPIMAESTGGEQEGGSTVDCPKCGETVETRTELKQLRSADEAETRIHHGTCGCTWREDD